jgi:ABC-type Na+ efflux pump permease subunit
VTNIFLVAKREFIATVATRAFIIGLLIVPVLIAVFALIGPRLFDFRNYKVQGEVVVMDPTSRVVSELRQTFDPVRIEARRKEEAQRALKAVPQSIRETGGRAAGESIGNTLGPIPEIRILERAPDADLEEAKQWLIASPDGAKHLAFVVIHEDAVEPAQGSLEYGAYDIYFPADLDDRAGAAIQRGLREAIVNARLQARALDRDTVDAIVNVPTVKSVTVTRERERETVRGFNTLLPAAFGVLLLMGVMGGGGQLLTTTVEEKSSRVVEVLLSAVSPMELMAGKLLAQMAVSLIGMALYLVMGIALLFSFALFGLLDFWLIFYLLIFFMITYFVLGSLMMAVGAAVNEMKEAQSLMAPLTIVFMVPWILWMPISSNPASTLSVAMSFVPPVNTFAMLLRMASNVPPPAWQVWISIAIGVASVYAAVWFSAKVYRIGLLMHGKPPNLATLVRWARSA